MATAETGVRSGSVEEFQACVADYRASVEELRTIESRMTDCVRAMRAEGAPRERLLAASVIVGNVREALNASRMPPAAAVSEQRRAA